MPREVTKVTLLAFHACIEVIPDSDLAVDYEVRSSCSGTEVDVSALRRNQSVIGDHQTGVVSRREGEMLGLLLGLNVRGSLVRLLN